MSGFNGAGVYVLRYTFVADAAAGIKILASRQDQMWNDMKGGFQNCYTLDSQTLPTQNLNMNSKKITGLAPATAGTDAPQYQQVSGLTAVATTHSSFQTVGNGVTTVLTFNQEQLDVLGEFNTTTYTFTAASAGHYLASVNVAATAQLPATAATLFIRKNGSVLAGPTQFVSLPTAAVAIGMSMTQVFNLAASDTLDAAIGFDAGTTNSVGAFGSFCIARIP